MVKKPPMPFLSSIVDLALVPFPSRRRRHRDNLIRSKPSSGPLSIQDSTPTLSEKVPARLVTSVLIAMPSRSMDRNSRVTDSTDGMEEPLPEVLFGVSEVDGSSWAVDSLPRHQDGVDVKEMT